MLRNVQSVRSVVQQKCTWLKFILAVEILLDFGENYVDIRSSDVLAVDDVAFLAELNEVLAVHLLSCGLCVSMDRELLEGGLHLCDRH